MTIDFIVNLDDGFEPYGSGVTFEQFTFPGGEPHIKLGGVQYLSVGQDSCVITARIKDFRDVGSLLAMTDALKRIGIKRQRLTLPYFPGARQDRLMVGGEPFTAKIYADIINAQGYEEVVILDPHSDVAPALINNCKVITNRGFISAVIRMLSKEPDDWFALVSPDAGATKKVHAIAQQHRMEILECGKVRNVKTGKIVAFKVHPPYFSKGCSDEDLAGYDLLLVDDICDGGATFIGLAEELKTRKVGKLYLAVTHGIFSKGTRELRQNFEQIFTTDSWPQVGYGASDVTVIPFKDIWRTDT